MLDFINDGSCGHAQTILKIPHHLNKNAPRHFHFPKKKWDGLRRPMAQILLDTEEGPEHVFKREKKMPPVCGLITGQAA